MRSNPPWRLLFEPHHGFVGIYERDVHEGMPGRRCTDTGKRTLGIIEYTRGPSTLTARGRSLKLFVL
eukprot:15464336-Alexandrium_andersonii.AAC.1